MMFLLVIFLLLQLAYSYTLQQRGLEKAFLRILKKHPMAPYTPQNGAYIPASYPIGHPDRGVFQQKSDHIYKCVHPGHISFTLDDGPSPFTESYLDILNEENVKATFFVIGVNIDSAYKKSLLKRILADGHTIGSHTWSHPSLPTLSENQIFDEIVKTEKAIYSCIGKIPTLFRAPYGEYDDRVLGILKKRGYTSVLWNIDTLDWSVRSHHPSLIFKEYKRVLRNADPGSSSWIPLQHDFVNESLEYMQKIIRYIRKKGFKIVDMATCLGVDPASLYRSRRKKHTDTNRSLTSSNQAELNSAISVVPPPLSSVCSSSEVTKDDARDARFELIEQEYTCSNQSTHQSSRNASKHKEPSIVEAEKIELDISRNYGLIHETNQTLHLKDIKEELARLKLVLNQTLLPKSVADIHGIDEQLDLVISKLLEK